ncbi:ATPase [Tunicatimonas pelagia]|uniref:ATPase n=1 Tax=Tunicatimonas pelagia TaxID=931531 RepID=UPI002664FEAA|nr:ATPase [Tunicatimonas pelagia]WKN44889.1 ATPase [Tunicatimonas pelagia]
MAEKKTTASPFDFAARWEQWVALAKTVLPNFTVDDYNRPVMQALLAYFHQHPSQCQAMKISRQKGILLLEPVGSGKTTLMQLFAARRFRMITAREIARQFLKEGYPVLDRYGSQSFGRKHTGYAATLCYDQPITYCFDDLGVEQNIKLYGNDCNVMAEVLLDRYDQFVQRGMQTHLTTNLNAEELERLYGDRLRSRMREMFNLVAFSQGAPDRRL